MSPLSAAADPRAELARLSARFVTLPAARRADFVAAVEARGIAFDQLPIVPLTDDAPDSLALAQRRLWFLWQLDPKSHAYNLGSALILEGRLDEAALRQAIDWLVQRHDTLRTVFVPTDDGAARPVVQAFTPPEIARNMVDDLPADARETAARAIAEKQACDPFDLVRGPLVRFGLVRIADHRHLLSLALHHIITDGWSMKILVEDLMSAYAAFATGNQPTLSPPPIRYADHAAWQKSWLEAGELERQLAWWKAELGSTHTPLPLPTVRPRPATQSYRGDRVRFALDAETSRLVRGCARTEGATLFMVLLAALHALLSRLTDTDDIRVGISAANRMRAEIERLPGFFVTTQVIRTRSDAATSFRDLLSAVKAKTLAAQSRQDVPFEVLVDALQPERSLGYNPLFQVKFTQQFETPSAIHAAGLAATPLELVENTTHFDLSLDVTDGADAISATLTYAEDLFDAPFATQLAGQYVDLVRHVVRHPEQPLGAWHPAKVSALSGQSTPFAHPDVVAAFAARVRETPSVTAVRSAQAALTFAELDDASTRLAHALRTQGVRRESVVIVLAGRGTDLIVALLGIIKAGGVYAPLDLAQPHERVQRLAADCSAKLALHDAEGHDAAEALGIASHAIADLAARSVPYDAAALPLPLPNQAAYLIYTSGSTGQPKGVLVPHRAIANYMQAMLARFALPPDASFGLVSTPAADLGHTMVFGALVSGRTLHLIEADAAFEADRLADVVQANNIGVLKLVPSHLGGLLATPRGSEVLPSTALVLGGEVLPPKLVDDVRRVKPGIRIFNHYGPTETTVGALGMDVTLHDDETGVPVGRPFDNVEAIVLDRNLDPVLPGAIGELFVGGEQVARGYLGKPGATAERFVPDPFRPGRRLYRTGDFVRLDTQGAIRFVGRRDDQVKIRGHRVELREIAQVLRAMDGIEAAEVVLSPADEGREQLVAYVVASPDAANRARSVLERTMPGHMVPSHVVTLERMPLTPNGKVDRAAFPVPMAEPASTTEPQSEPELILFEVWCEVLGRKDFGIDDNFFGLGGDSILSLQIIARTKRRGFRLTPKQVFEHQTIRALATVATPVAPTQPKTVAPDTVAKSMAAAEVPLTPVQLAFFARPVPYRNHWNQSVLLQPHARLELATLTAAFEALVARHDALRLRFEFRNGSWIQTVAEAGNNSNLVRYHTVLDTESLTSACEDVQRSLDIFRGPLLRALLVDLSDGSQRLLIVIHHLAVDGVSWRVLIDDLANALDQYRRSVPIAIVAPDTGFRSYAQALLLYAHSAALRGERDRWCHSATNWTTAPPPAITRIGEARCIKRSLSRQATKGLMDVAPAAFGARSHELMIAAFARAYAKGAPGNVALWLEGHGRDFAFAPLDLSRTVGWLTSIYPVWLRVEASLTETVDAVRHTLRSIQSGGVGYGLLRHLADDESRSAIAAPYGPIFNYLGRFNSTFVADSPFAIASEFAGCERDPAAAMINPVCVDARVLDDVLHIDWQFDPLLYAEAGSNALADAFDAELHALAASDRAPALPIPGTETYPLSPMQSGLLFQALLAPNDTAYVNLLAVTLEGLDVERFKAAWRLAFRRHDILRTTFDWRDAAEPRQIVGDAFEPLFEDYDWRGSSDIDARLVHLGDEERRRGFDLAAAPPMRIVLVRIRDDAWRFLWVRHHILLDGWSSARLLAEIVAGCTGEATPTTPAPKFSAYLDWLAQCDQSASEMFWRDALKDVREPFRLAHGSTGRAGRGRHVLRWEAKQVAAVLAAAQRHLVTVNTIVQAAWALVLARRTGRPAVFGITVSGRPDDLPDVEETLGLFINTLPIVSEPCPDLPIADYLASLQTQNVTLREHQDTPLYDIQTWSGVGGDALLDTLLIFENYPVDPALRVAGTLSIRDPLVSEDTHYALTLTAEVLETATFSFAYANEAFSNADVASLAASFQAAIDGLTGAADATLGSISLAPNEELAVYGPPAKPFVPLLESIRRRAVETPRALALVADDAHLTYADLVTHADAIAERLAILGVGRGDRVGVFVERGAAMVAVLLGVLGAGAAYVPLDPSYPAGRLAFMAADAGLKVLVTQAALRDDAPKGDWVMVDVETIAAVKTSPMVRQTVEPNDLAYIIYTSGSTGRPKGVMIEHAALANLIASMADALEVTSADRVVAVTSLSFDISMLELILALTAGGVVTAASHADAADPRRLARLLDEADATLVQATPSGWRQLMAIGWDGRPNLKALCGGEALPPDLAGWLRGRVQNLWNVYGPTETTIWSSMQRIGPEDGPPPIGRPIAATGFYVLDDALQPCPTGVAGELWISGCGLARGYHGRSGLTAERFVPDPFGIPGSRMYRTGDLAIRRDDGLFDHLGRRDHQVKIRGFRIELGEVEDALLSHPAVKAAAVLATPEGESLVAYAVADAATTDAMLSDHLGQRLPSYMVPSTIVRLDRLPTTPNGKLDRVSLPPHEQPRSESDDPIGDAEVAIAAIWRDVLGLARIGRDDCFFRIGGHSLTATRMIARIEIDLGVVLPLRVIFEAPTLKAFAAEYEARRGDDNVERLDALLAELDAS